MKTFVVDLHGALARLGPARPLLYPYEAAGELELLPRPADGPAPSRNLADLAEAVRVSVLREFRQRLQLIFLIDLTVGGLTEQMDRIGEEMLKKLAEHGLRPVRVVHLVVDTLAREPHTGAPTDDAARARWQSDVARLSKSSLDGALVLRYPLRRTPEAALQNDLIRLVYLLGALVELFHGGEEVARARPYAVGEVALDGPELSAWIGEYAASLQRSRRAVEHQLEHPEPVAVALIEDPGCACPGVLEQPKIGALTFGWLRGGGDLGRWLDWGEKTGAALARHTQEGEDLVRRCMRAWRGRTFAPVERAVERIAEKAEELRKALDERRRSLARQTRHRRAGPEWNEQMQGMTPRLSALIEARPRPRAFFIFTGAMLLLMAIPALLTLPRVPVQRDLPVAAIVFTAAGLATWHVLRRLRGELHLQAHQARELAQVASHRVAERAGRRNRHLEQLCEVEVARRNDAAAQRALQAAGERRRLLAYHRGEIDEHLRQARAFAAYHSPGAAPVVAQPFPGDEPATPARDWPVNLPPHQNPAYAPALSAGARGETGYEVRVGARVQQRRTTRLRGLSHVTLVEDLVYAPTPGRSSEGDGGPADRTGPRA